MFLAHFLSLSQEEHCKSITQEKYFRQKQISHTQYRTCVFCAEKREDFTDAGVEGHYLSECPMLHQCKYCRQVILELSKLLSAFYILQFFTDGFHITTRDLIQRRFLLFKLSVILLHVLQVASKKIVNDHLI